MYGFLCNPFSVTSQIKASKVQVQSTISDGDKSALDDADVSLMDSSLPTQSRPKPKFSLFRKASIQTLTDELYSFVMDIRWNHEAYQQFERKLLDSRGSFLTYTFDFSPLSPKSKLVKLLRQEFELNSNLWFSVEDIDNSVLSMTVLLENYFEYPPSFDQSSPYNQNCFTSLEYTFICSDILLAGLWRFYSLVPPTAVAPHESHLSHIRKFLAAVLQLYSLVGEEERLACGVAMCQIAMKASQVVHLLVMKVLEDIWNVGAVFKAIDLVYLLQEFLSIVVSVPSCGQLTQYLLTMKLWILIDILLRTVNRQIVFTESSVHMLQLYKNKLWKLAIQLMTSSHALVGAMQAQETQEVHPLSGMNEEGMERMIFDVITTAGSHQNGPSLLTLFALNDCEETASNSSHQGKAPSIALPWSLQLNTPFYLRFLVLSMIKVVHLDTTAITYRNKHLLQGSSSISMPMDVDRVFRVVYEVFVFTTKDKIVVERLYLAPTMAQLLLTMVPMMKSHVQCQWIFWNLAKSLSEFNDWLKLRLRALRQRGYSTTSDADLSYHDLGSGSGHASHAGSTNALHLANGNLPARATGHRTSFQRSNSRGHRLKRRGSDNSVDVVTIEDDEEMDEGDVAVGHTLSLSPSSTKSGRKTMMVSASAPGLLLPTTATIDENTAFHGQPMTSKHSIRLPSLAVSASQPTLSPLPQQQQPQPPSTTSAPTFAVGDRVDGNVTLTNGTQRWFPGKVTAYHAEDDTYDLLYDDGDKGNRIKACDVRLSKRRVRNNNNSNSGGSNTNQTAPQVSSTPASEATPTSSQAQPNANRANMLPILSPEALPSTTETTTATQTQLLKPIPVTFANTKSSPSNRPTTADMEPAAYSELETDDFPPKRSESPNILAVSASSDAEESNAFHARPGSKANGLFLGIAGVASQSQSDKLAALSLELSIKQVEADDDVDKDEKGDRLPNKDLLLVDEESDDDEDEDEDDDDHIFEIPSIFDQGHRATNGSHLQHREDLVPRMQFTNLPISSGIHGAPGGLSLSAALLADDETTSSSFVSNGDTPNGGAGLANNSLYNLNGLKVLSGRQTPSMVLASHRGSVLNNVGALSSTRSIMTTHRSLNNDQFVGADEGYLSIHRGSHHNLAHTFSGSMGHNTPSHLHIGNFHSALQQQQQQSHPYHTPVSAGRNAGDLSASTVSSVPTNTTRVLTWRGSANSMPGHGNGGSHGDSSSSRLASGRTMMLHSNGTTQAGGSTSSAGGSDAGGSRRPSIAPPEQLLNASHETRHLMHRASGTASHSGSRGQLRQRPSLSRQDSATRQGASTSAPTGAGFTGLANLSPSKRGLMNPHSGNASFTTSGNKRSASPASNASVPSKQQAMLVSSPPVGGNGAEMTARGTNISPSAAMMMLHAIPDETLLLEEQVAFRLLLQTHVLIALALVEFSVHQEEYAFTYLSQWATPALSSTSFACSQKYDTSLSSMPQFPSLPTSAMLFQSLKYASCVSQEHVSAATVAAVTHPQPIASTNQPAANELFTLPPSHRINMLFHVREFFELCPELWKEQDVLSTLLLHQQQSLLSGRIQRETSFERVLKLLSPMFFPQEMMQKRMQLTGERIGDGGFGSVFKMRLTLQDDGYVGLSHCLACYLQLYTNGIAPSLPTNGDAEATAAATVQCTCWRRTVTGSSTVGVKTTAPTTAAITTSVAVKRIARERSMFDESTLYALYQELTCLQAMQSCVGVCGLEHYGVCGSEYWMVMEHGRQSLLDWRLTFTQGLPFPSSPSNASNGSSSGSTMMMHGGSGSDAHATVAMMTPSKQDLFVMLLLWQDILLIVDALHRADIGHFDLKACNFLLRHDPRPYLAHIVQMHNQHQMSGFVFLADFGEAIPAISHPKNDALRRKCRGTLAIQSPEMLCISEDAERTVGVHSGLSRGFGSSTHLLSQKRGGPPPASLAGGASSHPRPLKETESTLLQQMNRHGALGDRIADHSHISLAQWIRHGAVVTASPGPAAGAGHPSNSNSNSSSVQRDDHDEASHDEPIDGIWQIARASPISLASPAAAASVSTPLKPTTANGPVPRFSPELERRLLPDTDNGSQKSTASMSTRMELGLPTKRSDLWSLGSLLCELLTGKMLFEDAQWVELFTCLCLKPLPTQQGVLSQMKHHFQKVDAIFTALLNEGTTTTATASLATSMEGAPSASQRTTPNNRQQSIKKLWDDVRHLLQLMLQQRPDDRAGPLQLFAETERMLHLHFVAELTEYTNQSQSQSPQYATRTSFVDGFNANKSTKTAAAMAAAASKSRKSAKASTNDNDNNEEILSAVRLQRREEAHLSSQASSPNGPPSKTTADDRFKDEDDDDMDHESPRFWLHMWQELRRDEQQPWMVPVQERVLLLDEALACALLSPLLEKHAHVVKERRSQVHGRVMLSASTKGNKSIVGVSNGAAAGAPPPPRDASATAASPFRQVLQRREALRLALAPLVALADDDTWLAPAASAMIDATKAMTQAPAAASLAPVLQLQGLWQADLEAFFPSVWRDQRHSLAHGRGAGGHGPLSRSRCNSATSMLSAASGNGGATARGDVVESEAPLLEVDLSPDDGDAGQATPRLSLAQRHLLGILYQRLRREVLFTVDMTLLALQSATSVRPPPFTLLPITAASSTAAAAAAAGAGATNSGSAAPRKPSMDAHSLLPKRTGSGSSSHRGNRTFYSHLKPSSSSSLASSSSPTTHHKQPPPPSSTAAATAAAAANNNAYYPYFVQPPNAAASNTNSNNNSVNFANATTSPPSGWPAYSNHGSSQNNSMRRIGYLAKMGSGISGISLSLMSSASNSISRVSHHTHHAAAAAQLSQQQCLRGAVPTPEMMQGRLMASSVGVPVATNQASAPPHVAPPSSVPLSSNQRASLGGPAVGGKATAHPGAGVTTANGTNGTVKRGIVWIRFYVARETPRRGAEDADEDDEALWDELSAYGDSVLRVIAVPLQLPRDALDINGDDGSDGAGATTTDDLAAAMQRVLWQHRARLQAASCVLVTLPSIGDACPVMPEASLLTPTERARRWYHRDTTEEEQELFRRHAQQRRARRAASDDDPELRRLNDDPNDTAAITAMRCWWAARRRQHRLATGAVLAAASAVSSLLTTTHLVELHEQQQQLQAAMVAAAVAASAAASNADGIGGGPRASFASVNGANTGATPATAAIAAAASASKPPLPHHNKATTAGMNKAALSVNIPVAGACPSGQGVGMGLSNGPGPMGAASSASYVRPTTAQWHRWQRDFTQSEMTHFLRRLRAVSSSSTSSLVGSHCLRFDALSSTMGADGLHVTCSDGDAGLEQVEQWTTFFRVFDHLTVHFVAMATDESRGK